MNRTNHLFRICIVCFLACLMPYGLTSCSYLNIPVTDDIQAKPDKKEGKGGAPVYSSAVVKGRIIREDQPVLPTLIAAYRVSNGNPEMTGYAVVDRNTSFMLYLPEGRYNICTFTDYNNNGIFENSEASGCYGASEKTRDVSVREGTLTTDIAIKISKSNGSDINFSLPPKFNENRPALRQITQNGQILKIYSEYFSPENAQTGYWNPSLFMKSFGAHIYLTEEYNPRKIPILFVHGTEGSPHNWSYIYMRLDLNRYQPFFFYYPSGIRIHLATALLNEELRELHKKYGFQKMAIVAHSTGGLTTRSFLNHYVSETQNNFIKLFITFATPWSGFGLADASQMLPHKSIPVWVDLGAHSDFIKTTLDEKLPSGVRHYNIYGKKDTLSGNKAIDERVLACASKSYEFDCTHDSILSDRKAFTQFKTILEKELW